LLEGEPVQVAGRLQFSGRVEVKNVSPRDVLIFDDNAPSQDYVPGLPTVLHAPPDTADVFWGLSKMPDYADFYAPEYFRCRVLPAGGIHRYEFRVDNPLTENSLYGNPAYENPGSSLFRRKPAQLVWRTLRVRVAYYALDDSALMHRLSKGGLSEGQMEEINGTSQVIFKYQQEITATVTCPEN
jgi:hypothetical protein